MKRLTNFNDIFQELNEPLSMVMHSGSSEPKKLSYMLGQCDNVPKGSSLITAMSMGSAAYLSNKTLKIRTFFPGGNSRPAFIKKEIEALRYPLSEIPDLFVKSQLHADLVFLQVSPADEYGYHSLGLSLNYMMAVLSQNPTVVAEINPQTPCVPGTRLLHSRDIDWFFDADYAPDSVAQALPQAAELEIAKQITSLVNDGDTLQLGIGALSDATAAMLMDRKNLGLHSGILSDSVQPLIEKGVITQNAEGRWKGVGISTMAAGTDRFYKFLHENDAIEFHPCDITHSRAILGQIRNLTAINSALQIDLMGNATSESIGGRHISLPGGLPDFTTAAANAPYGKSIISLRATSRDGSKSNILPNLPSNAMQTLRANQIDFIITEFGIANLTNRDENKRALAIANIAHPNFRENLLKIAHEKIRKM